MAPYVLASAYLLIPCFLKNGLFNLFIRERMCACVHGGGAEDESISSRPRVECRTDVGFDSTTLRS